jgi:hypothetical protein
LIFTDDTVRTDNDNRRSLRFAADDKQKDRQRQGQATTTAKTVNGNSKNKQRQKQGQITATTTTTANTGVSPLRRQSTPPSVEMT